MSDWHPIARDRYDPLKAGSIDGTDTEPHDRAVWRAMNAHYVPPDVDTKPSHTLFVGRLPHGVDEEQLHHKFSAFGVVEKISLIRDIVTGYSKRYCFVEYRKERDAEHAMRESTGLLINGCPVLVDWEAGHRLKGWVPRRLGGGWGGRKEAGQLRFGCRDRPWKKPIVIQAPRPLQKQHSTDGSRARSQDRRGSREGRHELREDRHELREDRHESREDRRESRGDWHGSREDRYGSREDRHKSREDRHESRHDRYKSREDRHESREDRDESREDRDESREDRYGSREDRHGSREDWHESREDRHNRDDYRSKERRYRREDRRDRHSQDSITSHKKRHTSAAK